MFSGVHAISTVITSLFIDFQDLIYIHTDSSGSWSAVGTDVQKVKKMKPTMMLDLDRSFKRYLVIHQFGHALGLEHEHQRTDFWDGIKKHIDTEN